MCLCPVVLMGSPSLQLSASACRALGAVFRAGPLPLPVEGSGEGESDGAGTLTKALLVKSLADTIHNTKQPKVSLYWSS